MSQENILIKLGLFLAIGMFLSIIATLIFYTFVPETNDLDGATELKWLPDETIRLNYDECKTLNRSLYINRLWKKDFRIPMCPEVYVVLYDKYQNIVFIFNEGNDENPKILTTNTICDNSTGKC